jgi:AraC family transcriptional regulator
MWSWGDSCRPVTVSNVFWKQKEAFLLDEDMYSDWVMFVPMEGRFRYRIGASEGEAAFGDLILCPPQTVFHREVMEPLTFAFYTFRWSQPLPEDAALPVRVNIQDHHRLSSTYHYMEHCMGMLPEVREERLEHYWQDLWLLLRLEAEKFITKGKPPEDPDMQEAVRYLQQHAYGPLLLKELGQQLGLSPVQFTRRFQAAYGSTPMEYVTMLRLQKAQALLVETDQTLDSIAEECGYENGFYLSRMFTKKMRLSPSSYRKTHRV